MKRRIIYFVIAVAAILLPTAGFSSTDGKVRTVVIDAGHGGKDPGASGRYAVEKDIALSIALKTGAYIEQYLPDVKVIYTRKSDKFIELHKRAHIANEAQADLFISIHCNANRSSKPYGAETYVMGLHKTEANLEVAQKENAAILKEEDYHQEYEGFDPGSAEAYIIFSLFQNAFLDQSLLFAAQLQDQFRERVGRKDRSVKQAGFLVLYKITMPGVLVETGFLSNPNEEQFLRSEKGQVYIASAIYRAFKEYKNAMEKEIPAPVTAVPSSSEGSTENIPEKRTGEVTTTDEQKQVPASSQNKLFYSVQFATSEEKLPLDAPAFKGITGVNEYYQQGLYKYISGVFGNVDEANSYKNKVRAKGFKDAFVVAFYNNERISLKEAKKLSEN